MRLSQFGVFHGAADDKMKNNCLIALKFDMNIHDGEIHYLNLNFQHISKIAPFVADFWSKKKPENVQRNKMAVTFDLFIALINLRFR